MKSGVMVQKYNGAIDALTTVVRTEGILGLYRGLWPNLRACPALMVDLC
jgi:solute carrier family 25 phosphate transporter 23/24/25/41